MTNTKNMSANDVYRRRAPDGRRHDNTTIASGGAGGSFRVLDCLRSAVNDVACIAGNGLDAVLAAFRLPTQHWP
jgi:hypothetical protein